MIKVLVRASNGRLRSPLYAAEWTPGVANVTEHASGFHGFVDVPFAVALLGFDHHDILNLVVYHAVGSVTISRGAVRRFRRGSA